MSLYRCVPFIKKIQFDFCSVLGRFSCLSPVLALSCIYHVISCHLSLSQKSETAGDEMRVEMRSNFNDPCGQIAATAAEGKK